ncbi:MAG: hypothetical protein P8N02_16490, partial [Actinomycetota bacterium]|nr:hypothetical protein [Actinomycetota bacterium]
TLTRWLVMSVFVALCVVSAESGAGAAATIPVDIDVTPDELGVWITHEDGTVEARGTGTAHYGDRPALGAGERVIGLEPGAGAGYWLFSNTGNVFSYGDAEYHGGVGHLDLGGEIIAGVPTTTGLGYFLLGADGGIFSFGDAVFRGSLSGLGIIPNLPVVSMSTTPDGYLLIAADGGTFAFGAAGFHGSLPQLGVVPSAPIVDLVPGTAGYLMLGSDGGIFNFGQSNYLGAAVGFADASSVSVDATQDLSGYVVLTDDGVAWPFGNARSTGVTRVSGEGNEIIDLTVPQRSLVRATHVDDEDDFVVWALDASNAKLDQLVDEAGSSDGRYLLDNPATARFEVRADSEWTIEVAPMSYAMQWRFEEGPLSGTGADVVAIAPLGPSLFSADTSGGGDNIVWHHRGVFILVRELLMNVEGAVTGHEEDMANTPVVSVLEVVTDSDVTWTLRID